jgi:signal transduction histidine kinase
VLAAGLALSLVVLSTEVLAHVLAAGAVARGAPAVFSPLHLAVGLATLAVLCGLGLVVTLHVPANPIGWIFFALGIVLSARDLVSGWAASTLLITDSDTSSAALWLLAPATESWILTYALLTALSFIFPDGRLVSSRWRPAAWTAGGVFALGYAVGVGRLGEYLEPFDRVGEFPWRFSPLLDPPGQALSAVVWFAMLAMLFVGAGAVAARFRRSSGTARQQLKWFAYAAATVPLLLVLCGLIAALDLPFVLLEIGSAIMLVSVPAATTVAILRYRLYDIDRLINQTIVYAVLSVLVAGAFAGIVVLGGTLTGESSAPAVALATLLTAVAARPARARVQREVDRRFSRRRYEALRIIESYVGEVAAQRSNGDVREVLARALGDPQLRVVYRAGDGPAWLDADGQEVDAPMAGPDRAVTVVGQTDAPIAALVHDPGLLEQHYLLSSVADAALFPLDNARLRAEVRRRLAEVRWSRARIVTAGYAERRRIERDLHDGAQQRLVALGVNLRVAQDHLRTAGPEVAAVLEAAVEELKASVHELRELARGLLPPGLADDGLVTAVRALIGRSPLPVELDLGPDQDLGRLPTAVEAAAYFVVAEGLTNAAKHARASRGRVSMRRAGHTFTVQIRDDGVGGAAPEPGGGLAGLAERVDTHGGRLRVEAAPGGGTLLVAELPCGS